VIHMRSRSRQSADRGYVGSPVQSGRGVLVLNFSALGHRRAYEAAAAAGRHQPFGGGAVERVLPKRRVTYRSRTAQEPI
jgi:hypothetical protein